MHVARVRVCGCMTLCECVNVYKHEWVCVGVIVRESTSRYHDPTKASQVLSSSFDFSPFSISFSLASVAFAR